MSKLKKKEVGSLAIKLAIISIVLGGFALLSDIFFGWPNFSHYFYAPGPVYGLLSDEPLAHVLKASEITEKLQDYRIFVLKPALMTPIKEGDYEGNENYKWRVTEMYLSLLQNILTRNEQFEYHIDKDQKKIFIWLKNSFEHL